MLMLLSILFPILAGFALLLSGVERRRAREIWVLSAAFITAALGLAAIFVGTDDTFVAVRFTGTITLAFRADGLASIFGAMVSILWVLASFYALEYMKHEGMETRFFGFFLMSFGVTLGVAFAANLVTMYLFYELLTLATLPLVMHAMDAKARFAGKEYILYSMTGAALGFVSMIFVLYYSGGADFVLGGALDLGRIGGSTDIMLLVYVLGFFGFGVKAAVFPFHKWLLSASVAPTPVTALLHAVAVVKSGVFAVIRLTYYSFGADVLFGTWAQVVVVCAAAFTIVYGSANGLRSPHLKRRLACSTISNLSYILLGAAMMTPAGLVAALAHMLFHAVNKITLFFCAGAVYYRTHKEYVYEVEGYGKVMPITMAAFTLTALGLMGVPPLTGFVSKWRLSTAALAADISVSWLAAAALIISALLTALYLMTVVFAAYFPRKDKEKPAGEKVENKDPNVFMTGPLITLCGAAVVMSIWAAPLLELVTRLVSG